MSSLQDILNLNVVDDIVTYVEISNRLKDENTFNAEELEVIKRARNAKINSHPKNCDIQTYHEATSLEALFGYLKLQNKIERIEEIISKIFTD